MAFQFRLALVDHITGLVFYVLLFTTGQWQRLVPRSWDVIPNAVSTGLQYLSLYFPANQGWTQYDGMQILAHGAARGRERRTRR